jgi:arylsulfatase A-like enzyme
MRRRDLIWASVSLAAMSLAASGAAAQPAKRPNILFVLADDLGFSDIGAFGAEIATPNLDAVAREGRVMTQFYATPMPLSRSEVMTGADHHRVGMGGMYIPWGKQVHSETYKRRLNDKALVVAEPLRDAGYHTYMIGTWHLGNEEAYGPKAKGFEDSYSLLGAAGVYFALGKGEPQPEGAHEPPVYRDNDKLVDPPAGYATDVFTDKLLAWLDRDAKSGRPFFAYAAYTSPHFPLQVTDEFIDRYKGRYDAGYDAVRLARIARQKRLGIVPADLKPAVPVPEKPGMKRWESLTAEEKAREARRMEIYAAMIENLDWNVGRLIARLKEQGRYDDTFIVFTSGNGAAQGYRELSEDNRLANMGRKGSWIYYTERWAEVSNAPFALWKAKPAEGGISVPAIFRLPGQKSAQPISHAPATIKDLAPTFLEIAGVPDPKGTYKGRAVVKMDGRSLLPHLKGQARAVHPADQVFADENSGEAYVRVGEWKAVRMTDQNTNPFERGDPLNAEHIAALRAGDMEKAAAIRARWPHTWRLYNIAKDRGETTDLAAQQPRTLERMKAVYEAYCRDVGVVDPI